MFCSSNYQVVSVVMITLFMYVATLSAILDYVTPQSNFFSNKHSIILWILVLNLSAFPLTPLFLTKLWAVGIIANATNIGLLLAIFSYNIFVAVTYLNFFKKLTTLELVKWGSAANRPSSTLLMVVLVT